MGNVHKSIAYKYLSNNVCTIVEEWIHGYFCLGYFSSSTHSDLVRIFDILEFHSIQYRIPNIIIMCSRTVSWAQSNSKVVCRSWDRSVILEDTADLFLGFLFLETDILWEFWMILFRAQTIFPVQHLKIGKILSTNWSRGASILQMNQPSPLLWCHKIAPDGKSEQEVAFVSSANQEWVVIREVVELQLRYLLSLLSKHGILQKPPPGINELIVDGLPANVGIKIVPLLFVISCEKSLCPQLAELILVLFVMRKSSVWIQT